jgi:hypothetical protein
VCQPYQREQHRPLRSLSKCRGGSAKCAWTLIETERRQPTEIRERRSLFRSFSAGAGCEEASLLSLDFLGEGRAHVLEKRRNPRPGLPAPPGCARGVRVNKSKRVRHKVQSRPAPAAQQPWRLSWRVSSRPPTGPSPCPPEKRTVKTRWAVPTVGATSWPSGPVPKGGCAHVRPLRAVLLVGLTIAFRLYGVASVAEGFSHARSSGSQTFVGAVGHGEPRLGGRRLKPNLGPRAGGFPLSLPSTVYYITK